MAPGSRGVPWGGVSVVPPSSGWPASSPPHGRLPSFVPVPFAPALPEVGTNAPGFLEAVRRWADPAVWASPRYHLPWRHTEGCWCDA